MPLPITVASDGPPVIAVVCPLEGTPQLVSDATDSETYLKILHHLDHHHHEWFRLYVRALELTSGEDFADDLDLDD